MKAVKITLRRLALYYFLLAVNIIPCANVIPDVFPARNVSSVYLLILSACIILYYAYRVTGSGHLPFMMRSISWMAFFLLLLRGLKYGVFAGVDILARHTWYMYYVPMLTLPLLFFYVSIVIMPKGDSTIPRKWYWAAFVSFALILLVLTNDLHGQVFAFRSGFENWDGDYSRGVLFYIVTAWQYLLYIAAVLILIFKCRIGSAKKSAWLTAIPFAVGIIMCVLLSTGKMPKVNGTNIVEFPEALICMVICVLECCLQLGLIPTNKNYGKIFGILSLSAQITDRVGNAVYLSGSAAPLTEEEFCCSDGARIGEHTVLHKMALPGGYGFWQDDMTELDRLNDELAEAKEGLSQEVELIRLQNELQEKRTEIEQRTAVYDTIAKRTRLQSQAISELARTARVSEDTAVKDKCRKQITLLASYVKRYANLVLLSYESNAIELGELGLSFSEVLRYLNFSGIPGELFNTSHGTVTAKAALAVFETFGAIIAENLSCLRGVFINISKKENAVCKLTCESILHPVSRENISMLSAAGVNADIQKEDDISYFGFTIPEKEVSS